MEPLAQRLARGDEAAFGELYDACAERLHAWLVARLGSFQDASDVLQETFVRLVRARKKLASVDDVVAYAFVVARNECLRYAHRNRQRTMFEMKGARSAEIVDDGLTSTADFEAVAQALAALEPPLREVIELKMYAELTLAQIAAALGIPPGTAATRYRTALERLRIKLKKEPA